jgi:hypothetical protein
VNRLIAGTTLTLQTVRLLNVRFERGSFLSLSAFNALQLTMTDVTIETDCLTLSTLANFNGSAASGRGPSHLYVASYAAGGLRATAVNVTCLLPATSATAGGVLVSVADG